MGDKEPPLDPEIRNRAEKQATAAPKSAHALVRFLFEMDARALRAAMVTLALIGGVAALAVLARTQILGDASAEVESFMSSVRGTPWAYPAVVLSFSALALVSAPQFLLIAATVVVFGPYFGFAYAWTATLFSASLTFWLGRTAGAKPLRRFGGESVNRLSQWIARHGFAASALVRILPSAPFIVVNMCAGASHISFAKFLAGTAIGTIPKTALIAFLGTSLSELVRSPDLTTVALLAGVVAVWILLVLVVRRLRRGVQAED